jgi:serine/threonine-protein kinase RsbW
LRSLQSRRESSDDARAMTAQLSFAPDLAEAARMVPWLAGLAEASRWPAELAHAIELCLDEVVTNIVMHGGAAVGKITIEIDQDAAAVRARIEDDGAGFDPTAEDRPLPESLDEAGIGGLGIVLVRRFSSALHYERVGGYNRLTLRFDRPT